MTNPAANEAVPSRRGLILFKVALFVGFLVFVLRASPATAACATLANCDDCTADPKACTNCSEFYAVHPVTQQCIVDSCKVENCTVCESPFVCQTCRSGHTFNSSLKDVCVPAPCNAAKCSLCSGTDANTCLVCEDGIAPAYPNGQCVSPDVPCALYNCTKCKDQTANICEVCEPGYSLTSEFSCAKTNGDAALFVGAGGLYSFTAMAVAAILSAALY